MSLGRRLNSHIIHQIRSTSSLSRAVCWRSCCASSSTSARSRQTNTPVVKALNEAKIIAAISSTPIREKTRQIAANAANGHSYAHPMIVERVRGLSLRLKIRRHHPLQTRNDLKGKILCAGALSQSNSDQATKTYNAPDQPREPTTPPRPNLARDNLSDTNHASPWSAGES
ncbi:MAG: hypothetical protein ACI8Z5_000638 [Lentimonas sp.]|jgi:hypothetical protein